MDYWIILFIISFIVNVILTAALYGCDICYKYEMKKALIWERVAKHHTRNFDG